MPTRDGPADAWLTVALLDAHVADALGDVGLDGVRVVADPLDAEVVVAGPHQRVPPGALLVIETGGEEVGAAGRADAATASAAVPKGRSAAPATRILLSGELSAPAAVMGILRGLVEGLPLGEVVRECGDPGAVLFAAPSALFFGAIRAAAPPSRPRMFVAAEAVPTPVDRVVDLRMAHPDGAALAPCDTLAAGARYELRVRIGAPKAGSLLTGQAPPIDPLLPELSEDACHLLDVVVHAQDFTLESAPVARIRLCRAGDSDTACFVVVAPARDRARLRVSIHHEDVLLQSFRVEAVIEAAERSLPWRAATARMDYSRAPGFAAPPSGWAAAAPRFACVSVNDAQDGAHDVMVKSGAAVGGTRISLEQAEAALKAFRATMTALTRDEHGQRYTIGVPPPMAMFAADVYRVAVQGWELVHALFDANPAGSELLVAMRERADLTVQLVRISPRLALPWTTIYDWDLPEQAPAEVCLGERDGAPCAHGPTDGILCVRGFWGVRHRLEELVDTGREWGDRAAPGPRWVAVDAEAPAWATLRADALPGGFTVLPPEASVIEALDGDARPGVLAILGHHAARTAGITDLSLPRIEVGPAARRLTRKALLERCHTLPKWADDARPLVLLMACDTAVPLDPYPDFVAPLLTKGAIGVVATECIVYADLVGVTTRRLLELLSGGAPLVDALRTARLELLRARNPLGFVFTALGNADLRLS